MDKITINTTLKINKKDLVVLENELRENFESIDFRVVPETRELYKTNKTFKKLVDNERQARKAKYDYLNKIGFGVKF
jgi:hypothetical protein